MHCGRIVPTNDMSTTLLRTRQINLALLVTAVVEHHQTPGSSAVWNANSSRLLRLGRELTQNAGRKQPLRHR
jgi:hypothetical protein